MKKELKFRNYNPLQPSLAQSVPSALGPQVQESVEAQALSIEQETLDALAQQEEQQEELELSDLAPKKPNWDLKRDLESKLSFLEQKTSWAVGELIRKESKLTLKDKDSQRTRISLALQN